MENNLLLVDDEENIVQSLVRRDGYNILTANSGAEGLEILKQNKVVVKRYKNTYLFYLNCSRYG